MAADIQSYSTHPEHKHQPSLYPPFPLPKPKILQIPSKPFKASREFPCPTSRDISHFAFSKSLDCYLSQTDTDAHMPSDSLQLRLGLFPIFAPLHPQKETLPPKTTKQVKKTACMLLKVPLLLRRTHAHPGS